MEELLVCLELEREKHEWDYKEEKFIPFPAKWLLSKPWMDYTRKQIEARINKASPAPRQGQMELPLEEPEKSAEEILGILQRENLTLEKWIEILKSGYVRTFEYASSIDLRPGQINAVFNVNEKEVLSMAS